ncbi:MAG: hypothetical protein MUC94_05095 [bacterium]|jgi:Na+-transporting methylmalonyl-CoA/oxaloacetate decarboxylase gamma subunit|nr:hypothetical protein [bacterium]
MFTNILLIGVGILFMGLMFYAFFMVLFSKKDYKKIPRPVDNKTPDILNSKSKVKTIGRSR